MDSLLHEGIKLTIIGTIFVFISLFFLYLMIKVLRVLLNKSKTKEFTKNDLDISLVLSASAAYFLGQSNEEIYIPIIVFLFLILITFFLRKKIKS